MAKNLPTKVRRVPSIANAFDPVSAALQQLHQAVENEGVPDEFLRLLENIDAKLAAAQPSSS